MTSIFYLSFILVFFFKLFMAYPTPENPMVKSSSSFSTVILKFPYDVVKVYTYISFFPLYYVIYILNS